MAGSVLKGALISYLPTSPAGEPPNEIVFQINPETITHAWTGDTRLQPPSDTRVRIDPLAVSGLPGETFTFTLFVDANEEIADTGRNPVAAESASQNGVYPRLAKLEMLQYPVGPATAGLLGQVTAANSAATRVDVSAARTSGQNVAQLQVPVVLFAWAERILPVRVTALTITERLYDAGLHPIHAEAQITLRVLTLDELVAVQGPMAGMAKTAYTRTIGLRREQAAANLGDSDATTTGMLPTAF
jgi:hypothetical protein